MKKLIFTLFGAALALSVSGAEYISTPMSVNPRNNTILAGMGDITMRWNGVQLELPDNSPGVKNQISLDNVKVTLNGTLNTAWKSYMEAGLYAAHLETTNEATGEIIDAGYTLNLYLGTMSYFWKGEINISIAEGVITTTTGEINPEINLTYYVKELTPQNDEIITPESGSEFNEGEGEIVVKWNTPGELSLNQGIGISVVKYDAQGEAPEGTISMSKYVSIADNSLIIDLSSLSGGYYSLLIPEGAVNIGIEYLNFTSIDYNFSILGSEEENPDDSDDSGDEPGMDNPDDSGDSGDNPGIDNPDDSDDEEPGDSGDEKPDEGDVDDNGGGDTTTGLDAINGETGKFVIYNLQGVKVAEGSIPTTIAPGIYIINGKKVRI